MAENLRTGNLRWRYVLRMLHGEGIKDLRHIGVLLYSTPLVGLVRGSGERRSEKKTADSYPMRLKVGMGFRLCTITPILVFGGVKKGPSNSGSFDTNNAIWVKSGMLKSTAVFLFRINMYWALLFRVKQLVKDFYGAGAETTATTLGWALYFMMKYPDVQTKVRVSSIFSLTTSFNNALKTCNTKRLKSICLPSSGK